MILDAPDDGSHFVAERDLILFQDCVAVEDDELSVEPIVTGVQIGPDLRPAYSGPDSPIPVDPVAPGLEVVGPTLRGHRTIGVLRDTVAIRHRNRNDPDLVGLRMFVPKLDMAPGPSDGFESFLPEGLHDLAARKIGVWHRATSLEPGWRRLVLADLVRIDADLAEERHLVFDRLPTALVKFEGFGEHRQRFRLRFPA